MKGITMETNAQPQAPIAPSMPAAVESPEGMKVQTPRVVEVMHGIALATLLITFGLLFATIAQAAYGF